VDTAVPFGFDGCGIQREAAIGEMRSRNFNIVLWTPLLAGAVLVALAWTRSAPARSKLVQLSQRVSMLHDVVAASTEWISTVQSILRDSGEKTPTYGQVESRLRDELTGQSNEKNLPSRATVLKLSAGFELLASNVKRLAALDDRSSASPLLATCQAQAATFSRQLAQLNSEASIAAKDQVAAQLGLLFLLKAYLVAGAVLAVFTLLLWGWTLARFWRQTRRLADTIQQSLGGDVPKAPENGGADSLEHLREKVSELVSKHDEHTRTYTLELEEATGTLSAEVRRRERIETKLRYDALHDLLTKLPNRAQLTARLKQCALRAKRNPEYRFAVLFVDIDNFKSVKDTFGHSVGDAFLVAVAKKIQQSLRSLDLVSHDATASSARLGGDEFVVLVDDIRSAHDAAYVAERLQQSLGESCDVSRKVIKPSASIGIAIGGGEHRDPETLLRDADTAMYRAKAAGRGQYAIFDASMHEAVRYRLQLENALRDALATNAISLSYQPIVNLRTGKLVGFEALMRWTDPSIGKISPDTFIPIAEETGLIVPLGEWAMRTACEQLSRWKQIAPNPSDLFVSVNIAKRQLLELDFIDRLRVILNNSGIDAPSLHIEITESTWVDASEAVAARTREIKAMGAKLYIDDFGTGYSSLSCLHLLPLDVIKIDRAFVSEVGENRQYAAVIHSVMTLAHHLGASVVAEGIENEQQLAAVLAFDCEFGQGYQFAKPLGVESATDLVRLQPYPVGGVIQPACGS